MGIMRNRRLILLPLLAAAVIYAEPKLDHGGKSLDFGKFQIPRKEQTAGGKNLIKNGNFDWENPLEITQIPGRNLNRKVGKYWHSTALIWSKDDKLRKKIYPEMRIKAEKDSAGRKNVFVIENRMEAGRYLDGNGNPMLAVYLFQNVPLTASDKPESYWFRMKAKGNFCNVRGNRLVMLICSFKNGTGKEAVSTGKSLHHRFGIAQGSWQDLSVKVTVPPGTKICTVRICLYGLGKFAFDDIRFEKAKETKSASVKIYPMYLFDNTAYLGTGQANVVKFGTVNRLWNETKDVKLHLILPDGVAAVSCSRRGKLSGRKSLGGGKTEYVFDIGADPISRDSYFKRSPNIILNVTAPASERDLEGICFLSRNGKKGEIEHFKMRIVPSFRSRQPKLFKTGICDLQNDLIFTENAAESYADFYLHAGMNVIHSEDKPGLGLQNLLHKKYGLDRCVTPAWAVNGYRFGFIKGFPNEIAFLDVEGKVVKYRGFPAVCPTAVYTEDPKFLGLMQPILDRELKRFELILPNWEPFVFDGRGCFCSRCRQEFIRYTKGKLKEQQIEESWPKKVAALYPEIWKKFRSIQHANVVRTMEKLVSETGKKMGKETHFVPEIEWATVTETGNSGPFAKQYDPLDYLNDLPWLAPWGPYLYTNTSKLYQYYPGLNIIQLFACEDMVKFINEHSRNGRKPKLIGMPGGGYGGAMSEPEALAMDTVSTFVAGFNGSIPWTFPFGCDYRWWRALARANDMIALNEDIVMNGSKVTGSVKIMPRTKLPSVLLPTHWGDSGSNFADRVPSVRGQSILQHRAFRKGKTTVVAVANFWAKGECFFTLAIDDLPSGKYAVTDQNGVFYGIFSNAELKKGILLQTGALRWNFFRFEKNGAVDKKLMTQQQMQKEMESVRKQVEAAAEKDDLYSRTIRAEETRLTQGNDLTQVKEIRVGGISLKAEGQFLRITAPDYTLLLSPDKGGRIAEYASRNEFLVKNGNGHLAQDGFWGPRAATMHADGIYKLISCKESNGGIEVCMEHRILPQENHLLAGLEIQKKYRFGKDGFQAETTVRNKSDADRVFRFRYHNLPEPLRNPHTVYLIGKQRFERTFNIKMYRFGAPDPDVESLAGNGRVEDAAPGMITLLSGENAPAWKMVFPPEKIQAAVFWDSLHGSSAEIIFRKTLLKPGESETFSMSWGKQQD